MTAWDVSPGFTEAALAGLLRPDTAARDAYARAVWSVLTEPGDRVAGHLVAILGASEALRRALGDAPMHDVAVSGREVAAARERWLPRADPALVSSALERARRAGARLVVPGDPDWPSRLFDLGDHAPHALWVRGDLEAAADAPAVAIVGARAATGYGDHVAGELSAELAADGIVIVSGAAYGIDGVAHRAALAAGGRTAALLAGGVDRPYPSGHTELLERIARRGVVVSETPCGTAPSKWRFLARNPLS